MFLEFTLWDDSPIIIDSEMIVDFRPAWDVDKVILQTVRDSWPVKESYDEIKRALESQGIRIKQLSLLAKEKSNGKPIKAL